MTVLVADASASVSLGTDVDRERSLLNILVETFRVCLPERVRDELREHLRTTIRPATLPGV